MTNTSIGTCYDAKIKVNKGDSVMVDDHGFKLMGIALDDMKPGDKVEVIETRTERLVRKVQ